MGMACCIRDLSLHSLLVVKLLGGKPGPKPEELCVISAILLDLLPP